MKAKDITEYSIVKMEDGRIGILANTKLKTPLIMLNGENRRGVKISRETSLEVVCFAAKLASEWMKKNVDEIASDLPIEGKFSAITNAEAAKIIDTRMPRGFFLTPETDGTFTAIDNENGDAFTENFPDMKTAVEWLNGIFEVGEDDTICYSCEKTFHHSRVKWTLQGTGQGSEMDVCPFCKSEDLHDIFEEIGQ